MSRLQSQEIESLFQRLGSPGRAISLAKEGQRFSGVYLSKVHVAGLTYGVVEGKAGIVLAPWRAAMEACRSQAMTGVLQAGAVDFTLGLQAGRGRGLEL